MRAYRLTENGPAAGEAEPPRPGPADVLVRVRAAALNRADVFMAAGKMHGRRGGTGSVLGLEWAGEVVEVGDQVAGPAPGDRVMCTGSGAFAEYACTDYGRALPVPDGMSFEQAAGLPVALQTMHDAVVTHGALRPGQAVVVRGASSGVGLMAMQIAKVRGAGLVVGTSTDEGRRARLGEFGADLAVDSSDPSWVDQVLGATKGRGADLVVDQVSGGDFDLAMRATRLEGRIVNVGRLGGRRDQFDFDLHALRRITYVGVTFRTRTAEEVREITRRLVADLWDDVVAGRLGLPVDRVFPFDQVPEALAHMAANRHFGKIVVTV